MKKMKLLCAALTVIMLLTACSGSTSSAAEKVIGTTDKVVAADTLKPLAKADKEKLGYQLDMPEKGEEICVLTTNYGTIRMRFFPDAAPKAVYSFKSLALSGYYDGVTFHRVIDDFMIQGGDPEGTGMGGPGYSIKGEFSHNGFKNDLLHTKGVLSMARTMMPNSAGSQFFIMHKNSPHLDGAYAAFGKIIEGMDIVNKIAETDTDYSDRPLDEQKMKKVTVDTMGTEYPEPEKA